MCTLWEVVPTLGIIHLEKVILNWCLTLTKVINYTTLVLEIIQATLNSLVRMVMHSIFALDFPIVPGLMP